MYETPQGTETNIEDFSSGDHIHIWMARETYEVTDTSEDGSEIHLALRFVRNDEGREEGNRLVAISAERGTPFLLVK